MEYLNVYDGSLDKYILNNSEICVGCVHEYHFFSYCIRVKCYNINNYFRT